MSSIVSSKVVQSGNHQVGNRLAPAKTNGGRLSGWTSSFFRNLVVRKLAGIKGKPIALVDVNTDNAALVTEHDQQVVRVLDPSFYRKVVTGGSLGAAESYIQGDWECDDLTSLLRVFVRELKSGFRFSKRLSFASDLFSKVFHWARRNTRLGSRKNISAHYDLGNDFFQLMLDETMTYSSGCFESKSSSLYESQIEKYRRLAASLQLNEHDHLLEIGTGWGGMAIYAALETGCRVTTTTISQQQFDFATKRIEELGLQDRINVVLQDYRDLTGQFDKIVSIEMIEAVGHKFLPQYFQSCSSLLKPGGKFAFQVISMPDQAYQGYLRRADFIQRYVFPGSCCPALGALVNAYSQTDFRSESTSNIGPDYAVTLRMWREKFKENIDEVRALGYPEEFLRLWDYYLCYCEAGFAENYLSNYQILLSKDGTQ